MQAPYTHIVPLDLKSLVVGLFFFFGFLVFWFFLHSTYQFGKDYPSVSAIPINIKMLCHPVYGASLSLLRHLIRHFHNTSLMARPPESNSDTQSSPLKVYVARDDHETIKYFTNVRDDMPGTTSSDDIPRTAVSDDMPRIAISDYEMNLEPIPEKQKLGYLSVASLIINNMVGVGKY